MLRANSASSLQGHAGLLTSTVLCYQRAAMNRQQPSVGNVHSSSVVGAGCCPPSPACLPAFTLLRTPRGCHLYSLCPGKMVFGFASIIITIITSPADPVKPWVETTGSWQTGCFFAHGAALPFGFQLLHHATDNWKYKNTSQTLLFHGAM